MSSEAPFIFQGTVVAVGAATLEMVEADDLTAIVRVDRVLRAPPPMEHITGREITVRLREPAEVGASAMFAAEGWLFGESMAVIEVAPRQPAAEEEAAPQAAAEHPLESAAAADRAALFRTRLKARAEEATAVVVGRVTGVRQAAAATEERLSEHDPHWAVATVEVDQAVKGRRPARTIEVLFATSQDVMWHRAPKLAVGQTAVMLLHRGAPEVKDKRARVVLDELDVQPADSAGLVAELL